MISLIPSKNQVRTNKIEIQSIAEVVIDRIPLYGDRPVIRIDNGEKYINICGQEYCGNLYRMISYFTEAGETKQQKVIATFVKNRPEWDMTAFACLYTANILSPLDTKMNDNELRNLLSVNPPDYMLVAKVSLSRIRNILVELNLSPILLICDMYAVFEDLGSPAIFDLRDNEKELY